MRAERFPRVFSIPAGTPFVDALAAGLLERHGHDPLVLSRVRVLLPTRRSCRSLRDAFLRASGGRALLLPAIAPLGDVDEAEMDFAAAAGGAGEADLALPPAIAPLQRLLTLARLVRARPDMGSDPGTAVRLAEALAGLLDSVVTEGLSLDRLDDLVPAEHAEHWRLTLDFLRIVREHWPAILADLGLMEAAERRIRLLAMLVERWRTDPPSDPVYAAGSTGSIPATAELLKCVAWLPAGAVVLPGLDAGLDTEAWDLASREQTHPQFGLAQLLTRIGIDRREVVPWPAPGPATVISARARMLGDALRPAATTDAWRMPQPRTDAAFAGFRRLECATAQEEASVIAVILRGVLQRENCTGALITPDRTLARRVAAELRRWQIEVDDSAGQPLDQTPPATLLRLTAWALAGGLAPVALLAALKHPLAVAGLDRGAYLRRVRRLDRRVLRGPRPAPGFDSLLRLLHGSGDRTADPQGHADPDRHALIDLVERIAAAARPLADLLGLPGSPLLEIVDAHVRFAEWLATPAGGGPTRLWDGPAGEALHAFIRELMEAGTALGDLPAMAWPSLLEALMAGRVVRPAFGRHPRLFIWGPLEARLQQADVLVLGGLNEGTWPPEPAEDPWMSRPMRARFGLPLPERRIGLAAHDFVQAASAAEVWLTRAAKMEGAPTVPSRWLLRLDAMLEADTRWQATKVSDPAHWQRLIDEPECIEPSKPPQPRPPVAARPRSLSVTRIEVLTRDPYAIYARYVLGLKMLDPLEADPGAIERGQVIHRALDRFVREHPADLPADAEAALLACGEQAFGALLERPAVRAFWWPRFRRIGAWFIEFERARRAGGIRPLVTEVRGELVLNAPAGRFVLRAFADRIDRLPTGQLAILDYKTGAPPSGQQVMIGFAPQLPLEAAIARAGGFDGVPAADIGELAYVRLRGGAEGGEFLPLAPRRDGTVVSAETLANEAAEGLLDLVSQYDSIATPYLSRPRPQWIRYPGEYDHLARVSEWQAGGDEP